MNSLPKLPEGWLWVTFPELAQAQQHALKAGPFGSALKKEFYVPHGYKIYGQEQVIAEDPFYGNYYIDKERYESLKSCAVKPGDILISLVGTIGKALILPEGIEPGIINPRLVKLSLDKRTIISEYSKKYLESSTVRHYFSMLSHGGTMDILNLSILKTLPIPLPPLNEQHRIVAKIEALKARSQKAKEALETIPPLLDQFRQSVLAAAFRGDLTADWRRKNPQFTKEWHRKLLDTTRISITQTKQQGRLWGSGTSAQEVDKTWFKLPDTWNWTKVIDLGYDPDTVVQIGPMSMKSNEFTETGTTVLNVGCVQWDGLNLAKCNHLPPERASDFERYRIRKNDVLFTRSGAVGRSAIVTSEVDGALITFHLLRVRTSLSICLPEYLYFAFRGCNPVKAQIDASAIGATRAGFNTRLLQQIWLPLPPPEEQDQILQEIQKRFELIDTVAHRLNEINEYLKTLDQSILAKAFRGELVPQDPNDEPASVLLERIQAERAKREAEAKTAKKSRGKTTGQRSSKAKQQDLKSIQLGLPGLE